MLSERERNEVVAAVAKDLGVAVSPNDPVFVAVAANQHVLARATSVRSAGRSMDEERSLLERAGAVEEGLSGFVAHQVDQFAVQDCAGQFIAFLEWEAVRNRLRVP